MKQIWIGFDSVEASPGEQSVGPGGDRCGLAECGPQVHWCGLDEYVQKTGPKLVIFLDGA